MIENLNIEKASALAMIGNGVSGHVTTVIKPFSYILITGMALQKKST
jgi:hypothetical protein